MPTRRHVLLTVGVFTLVGVLLSAIIAGLVWDNRRLRGLVPNSGAIDENADRIMGLEREVASLKREAELSDRSIGQLWVKVNRLSQSQQEVPSNRDTSGDILYGPGGTPSVPGRSTAPAGAKP